MEEALKPHRMWACGRVFLVQIKTAHRPRHHHCLCAPFADLPKPLQLLKRGLRRHANGDRVMTQVLAAVPIAGLDAILVAVELVLESGSLSAEHILNVLARLTSTAAPPSAETSLQLKIAPVANTARYDRLRTTDEETRNA